jgi:uncharacterized YigZ family protein
MEDAYTTVEKGAKREMKVLGSRFLGLAFPCDTKESAETILSQVRKEFHDATHHCFAWRFGTDGGNFRFSDDGEPAGTAGKPILAAIDRHALTDVLVVVVRYFGGTKLGTGGLARAYGEAGSAVLAASSTVRRYITQTLTVSFPHPHTGTVMHALSLTGSEVVDSTYDEEVHLTVKVRKSRAQEVCDALMNATAGCVQIGERGEALQRGT